MALTPAALAKEIINHRPWEYYIPAFRVFGNLHFVGNRNTSPWIVETSEGPILFDTSYPTMAHMQIQSIWEAGFDPRKIIAIFHTHGHYDHFGTTELIRQLSGAKVYLGADDAKMFRERPELALIPANSCPLSLFTPDVEVNDGDVFTFGDTTIRCVHTPGHCPGATSYFFPVTDGKQTLTCGLHGGAGMNAFSPAFQEKYQVNWRQDFFDGIEKVMNEDVDIFLGNHTSQNQLVDKLPRMTEDYNPFIDKSAWQAFLMKIKKQLEDIIASENQA